MKKTGLILCLLISFILLSSNSCQTPTTQQVEVLQGELTDFLFNESQAKKNKTRKIMLFGDSWAQFLIANNTFDRLLDEYGYNKYYAGGFALIGSKAEQWALPAGQALIASTLRDNKEITVVVLTLGGNDFLKHYNTSLTKEQRKALFQVTANNVDTLLRVIMLARRDVRVAILGYDYPNLVESLSSQLTKVNANYHKKMGKPTPAQVNGALIEMNYYIKKKAEKYNRVVYVNNLGLMQYVFGYKHLKPGTVPYPGGEASGYNPFPGGDPNYPSPPEAMFKAPRFGDAIHLSAKGYYYVGKNAFIQHIDDWLKNP